MRRLISMLCLAAGLMVGAGCCHTCDVCDDCGGCNEPYAMSSSSGCATCGNNYASKPTMTKKSTSIAMPVKSTVKTR
ncbi:hypothetical protein K2Y11_23760 [bacterium]|nr:hypothetical protein [bacterium]